VQNIVACPHCGKKNRVAARDEGVPRCANCHHALPWSVDADTAMFDAEIRASVPVVVDFWAPWCGPCRMITPVLEDLVRAEAGRIKLVKVNVDEEPEVAQRFDVQGIPLLVRFADGAEADRQVGAVPPQQLRAWLEPHLSPAPADVAQT
jgi:thioredoxin 2